MLARFHSVALVGIEAFPCEVEVDIAGRGMKDPVIVGLPDTAVKESLERIHSALENCGYEAPNRRVTVNLAPADLRKEGPAFDLPIALGMVFANGLGTPERSGEYLVAGELALDGRVRPIKGALSMALLARERKFAGLLAPRENAAEAAVVEDIDVIPVPSLSEAVGFFTEQLPLEPARVDLDWLFERASAYDVDFADVRGQAAIKRALVIASAEGHSTLLTGPPVGFGYHRHVR